MTPDTLLGNEKALADFTLKYFIIGEDKQVYLCTDKSRQKCSFIDDRGNHIEDNNQEILLRLTSEGFDKVQEKYKERLQFINTQIVYTGDKDNILVKNMFRNNKK